MLAAMAAARFPRVAWAASPDVRVGVFGLFRPTALTFRSMSSRLSIRTAAGSVVATASDPVSIALEQASIAVSCAGRWLRAPRPANGRDTHRGGAPGDALVEIFGVDGTADIEIGVPGRIVRTFRGRVDVGAGDEVLVAAVSMDREIAVASVIAAEQRDGAPASALAAQGVAARSYYAASPHRHDRFAFCDTTHCQFIRGPAADGSAAAKAALDTAGLLLVHRGRPIAALYSASCGGRTRSLSDAGLASGDGYPYFAVDCAYCAAHAREWRAIVEVDEVTERLAERTETARIAVNRRDGWSTVPGNNFDAMREGDALVLRGRGAGHGIGLCQAGAAAMATQGASFRDILATYYPGTTLG